MKRFVLPLALLLAPVMPLDTFAGEAPRAYASGNFALEAGGESLGFLKGVDGIGYTRVVGGNVVADAVPTPVDLTLGFASQKALDWVAGSVSDGDEDKGRPRSVEVVALDYKLEAKARYELVDFAITEVVIPACDGSVKEAAFLRVRGQPKRVGTKKPGRVKAKGAKGEQKQWLPQNFRLTIDGIDTTKVNRISPITVKRGKGGARVSRFEISVAASQADTWTAWAEQALVAGKNDTRAVKIEFLSPSRADVLMTVDLTGVSILSLPYVEHQEAGADTIPRRTFVMGAEGIKIRPTVEAK